MNTVGQVMNEQQTSFPQSQHPNMITFDFTGIDTAEDFSRLPQGKYLATFQKIETKQDDKGRMLWAAELMITTGRHQGETIRDNIYLQAETQEKTLNMWKKVSDCLMMTFL